MVCVQGTAELPPLRGRSRPAPPPTSWPALGSATCKEANPSWQGDSTPQAPDPAWSRGCTGLLGPSPASSASAPLPPAPRPSLGDTFLREASAWGPPPSPRGGPTLPTTPCSSEALPWQTFLVSCDLGGCPLTCACDFPARPCLNLGMHIYFCDLDIEARLPCSRRLPDSRSCAVLTLAPAPPPPPVDRT